SCKSPSHTQKSWFYVEFCVCSGQMTSPEQFPIHTQGLNGNSGKAISAVQIPPGAEIQQLSGFSFT
ncbi:MAG: hypothetical protein ACYC1F_11675, partial [Gallionellaceae bacterium]